MSAVTIPTPTVPAPQTPAVTPPPVGSVAPPAAQVGWRKHRWTLTEYGELSKTGLFHDVKTMLIRGELFVMTLPNPPHNLAVGLVEDWLRVVFAQGHHVRGQMALNVGTETDPGPDVAVVRGLRRDYPDRQPTEAVLVVEVSDSTLFYDTATKAELYATAGVPDYWVIDLNARRLLIYRDPEPLPEGLGATAYRTHAAHGPDATVAPLAAPSVAVTVSDLLP